MSRLLTDLHPKFRPLVDIWLEDMDQAGMIALITCTLRTGAEQDQLYAIGRTVMGAKPIPVVRPMGLTVTNAKAGQSAHQYGLAIDFVPMNCGKPDWSGTTPIWNAAIKLAQTRGMESLRPMESAHLQMESWRTYI
jgi:peptidoglycan L-alanyl-D-glutamate endopeptidase CwlK